MQSNPLLQLFEDEWMTIHESEKVKPGRRGRPLAAAVKVRRISSDHGM
jgi:translation elongation factor P/translation initiation factor 5A